MKLMDYQKEAIKAADKNNFVAYFMKPGTGKTLPALISMERAYNRGEIKSAIIICVKTLMFNWELEIKRTLDIPYKLLSFRTDIKPSDRAEYIKRLKDEKFEGLKIIIVNYEKAVIMRQPLTRYAANYYIVDESHYIKNPRAKRSAATFAVTRKSERGLILTGTPIAGGYEDLYMQVRIMYPELFGTYKDFRERYLRMGGFHNKQIIGYKNVNELRGMMKKFIVTADSIIKEPEELFIGVTLPDKARKIYEQLNREMIATLDEISTSVSRQQLKDVLRKRGEKFSPREPYLELFLRAAPYLSTTTTELVIVKHLRMLQLCGGFLPLDSGAMEFIHDSKASALLEYLMECKTDKPVLIFARFVAEIEYLGKILKKYYRVANFRREKLRDSIYMDFQKGKYDVLLMQIGSGGSVGLNLQLSDTVIFYSVDDSGDHLEQAIARIRRTGQMSESLRAVFIVCENTLETRRISRVKHKSRMNKEFLKTF
jgi:SNF2 family DNA or RNA helicase